MRELLFVAVLLLLFSAVFLPQTAAEIKSLTISDDSRPVILFEMFGFTHTGHVNVSVSSVSVVSRSDGPIPDPSRLGFFLLSEESLRQVLLEIQRNPTLCILDSHYVIHLFTFRDLSPPPRSRFDLSYSLTSPSGHSLFFANCAPETRVSMEVRTAMYNLDAKGSKDYLPSGLTRLPGLYFFFFLCYWAFLCIWVYICSIDRRLVHRIHLLMAALLLMKTLNLISEAAEKYYVKFTGTPHGWDVLFYIFQFIRTVLLFTVIVSIGNDRSSLQNREKKVVLMIVIPLQVLANIASIVVGKTGPYIRDWVIWNQVFLLADVTCCCVIIFHIVRTIRVLKKTSKTGLSWHISTDG
ncbi:PREDICTED: protein GPR107 isoform X2 [Tarenaya hassleriana]|uniref:protein GPR107 isoform X2 n=1 Tax=Tarenaya hassleriana TaxID=28532 RepID=UPI00053C9B1E|nr:PREDICTED: protein GPR107 isoform X2 [Tarenaya hassleriana]